MNCIVRIAEYVACCNYLIIEVRIMNFRVTTHSSQSKMEKVYTLFRKPLYSNDIIQPFIYIFTILNYILYLYTHTKQEYYQ